MTTTTTGHATRSTLPEAALTPRPYPGPVPSFAVRAVLRLRAAVQALADALTPAHLIAAEKATGVSTTMILGAFARYGLADLLEERPQTAAELAARTGLDADALHRTLRGLAYHRILKLRADGTYANTRASRALTSTALYRTRAFCEYFASGSNVAAWRAFDDILKSGRSAFPRVHGESVWAWFAKHPDEEECFAHAMMGITVNDAPFVATLYPFAETTKLCDVGGGRGTLLSELLIRHPRLTGMLCDAEGVIASAASLLERRGVAHRVERVVGNFFEAVPAGADAYLLKNILHDWDDDTCVKILSVVRRSTSPGHKLILVENLVERNDARATPGVLSDLQMLVVCDDGRERSAEELFALMERAGFRRGRLFRGPTVSVVEGVAV